MKRFIAEYANNIKNEIWRRYAVLNDPRKLSVYNRAELEKAETRVNDIWFYAENGLITESETMLELVKADPRNAGRI